MDEIDQEIEAGKMADEHWYFLRDLFHALESDDPEHGASFGVLAIECIYKKAFIHGWKHGIQRAKETRIPTELETRTKKEIS